MRQAIPFAERRGDLFFLGFFALNLFFITYIVDFEQIVIADPAHFTYPIWPPGPLIDAVHWWGHTFDPVLLARPVWWKVTIWADAIFFGPFYAVALYAFIKGKEWIRNIVLLYSAALLFDVATILSEEAFGPSATPHLGIVVLANAMWVIMPIALIVRMWGEHPFTRETVPTPVTEPTTVSAS